MFVNEGDPKLPADEWKLVRFFRSLSPLQLSLLIARDGRKCADKWKFSDAVYVFPLKSLGSCVANFGSHGTPASIFVGFGPSSGDDHSEASWLDVFRSGSDCACSGGASAPNTNTKHTAGKWRTIRIFQKLIFLDVILTIAREPERYADKTQDARVGFVRAIRVFSDSIRFVGCEGTVF